MKAAIICLNDIQQWCCEGARDSEQGSGVSTAVLANVMYPVGECSSRMVLVLEWPFCIEQNRLGGRRADA